MPFDAEPPGGDYAAYIDRLVNRGTGTPGAQGLLKTGTGGFRPALRLPGRQNDTRSPGQQYTAGTGIPSAPQAPPAPSANMPAGISEPASQATLAAQGSRAVGGTVQILLGVLFGVLTVGSIVAAFLDEDPLEPFNIFRTVALFILARVLILRGRRALQGAQAMPGVSLPPFVPPSRPSGRDSRPSSHRSP
ncbi:MAG: phage holin family protein [Pigmentiphaga sp.]|uniref:phage holin family protein n=1 Tax=Pigmentiphaga sp. TaxID=1977564 RepID=UPI0029B105D3|nr:phage holin family protein [Pigmentiphaga sp.]MDX3904178.1 phage holin family protein [Pigmentiphaga sp.]